MSNGKIEYSLGLATGGFLGPLSVSRVALAGFAAAAAAGGTAIAGVMNEINRGGALKDLSNRTAESVRDLFQLQFAFEQSGIAAGNVAPILQKYRASLSGIGEMGEDTASAFSLIGVSIEDLKKLDAPQALQAIFGGLAKLDRNTAAGAASKIFGRGSSGDILQLARDAGDFAGSLKEAAAQAAQMDRMAGVFDSIGDRLGDIKLQIRGVFLNLASDVGPALNGILTTLATKDFATLGKIAELSLTVAFEKSVNFLANSLAKLFASMPDMIKAGQQAGGAVLGAPMARAWAQLNAGSASTLADSASNPESKARFEAMAEYWASVANATEDIAPEMAREAAGLVKSAFEKARDVAAVDLFGGGHGAELDALLKPFAPGGDQAKPNAGLATSDLLGSAKGGAGGEGVNALRRIGFGSGGGDDVSRSARQTATNTARLVEEVKTTNRLIFDKFGNGYELPND